MLFLIYKPAKLRIKIEALAGIRSVSTWIIVHPNIDWIVIAVVNRFPGVKKRLKKIVYGIAR